MTANNITGRKMEKILDYKIVENTPSPEDYNNLRRSVGWGICEEKVVGIALSNSLYCVCIYLGNEIIGMGRVIGDHGLYYYLQDIIVKPAYHRKGVGSRIMDRVMNYVRDHASHNSIIGLMSAFGKEDFYEKYGLIKRPNDYLGCGMTMCIDRKY